MADQGCARLFERVREAFARRGLLGRALRVEALGRSYSVRCDDECFTVYRVNDKPYLPPGLPGWIVCRLGPDQCFSLATEDQGGPPVPGEAAGAGQPGHLDQAEAWVELVLARL
jgi:hypothetical protein